MGISSEGTVKIIVKGDDQTKGVFKGVLGRINGLGKAAALAGAAAVAAAGVAIAAVAAKGIGEFMKFEDGINEVFTLLPGISGAAMDEMKGQVLDVSVAMGRLPEEVIPALYQALSAGVPRENVFDFLDQAHRAALGGVTDLETAVDGITSVVNAYGSDVMTAAEASDIMFTTVRLGKTNFEELSASLSNVTPLASGMGISFMDVSAAMAAMTAQGTPTAVATTQLRALFQELGTAGTEVNGIFEELAGQSFLDFIDAGGNTAEALALIEEHAIATNTPIQDMFGNVRGGLAALQLTGKGMETFTGNLDEMAGSAGATDAAFNTMNTGMARTFEQIKARITVTFIKIGEALEPVVRILSEKLFAALEELEPVVVAIMSAFETFFGIITGGGEPIGAVTNLIFNLLQAIGVGQGTAADFAKKFREIATTIVDVVIPGIKDFISNIIAFLEPVIQAVTSFVSWKDVLIALGAIITGVILAAIASLIISLAPVLIVIAAIIGIVALLRNAWENDWGGIQEKVQTVIAFVTNFIQTGLILIQEFWATHGEEIIAKVTELWEWIQTTVQTVIAIVWSIIQSVLIAIQDFWAEHGDQIIATVTTYFEVISTIISTIITVVQTIITTVLAAIQSFWEAHGAAIMAGVSAVFAVILNVIQTVIETVQTVIETVLTAIQSFWEAHGEAILEKAQQVWEAIQSAIETVLGILDTVFQAFKAAFEGDWTAFGELLRDAWDDAWAAIQSALETVGAAILEAVGVIVTSIITFFTETDWLSLGESIIQGIIDGLAAGKDAVIGFVTDIASGAVDAIKGFFGIESPSKVMFDIGENVVEGLVKGLSRNISAVQSVSDSIAAAASISISDMSIISPEVIASGIGPANTSFSPHAISNGRVQTGGTQSQRKTVQQTFYLTANYKEKERDDLIADVKLLAQMVL